jgi:uncharacterized protein (DUF1800 family)
MPQRYGPPTPRPGAQGRHRGAPSLTRLLQAGEPALLGLVRNRRQVLFGVGATALAGGAIGSAAAALGGGGLSAAISDRATSPRDAGAFADRDASYVQAMGDAIELGADGVADTPAEAAAAALQATPTKPNPLSRDPMRHLLRRATHGPTKAELAALSQTGIDAWIDAQLAPTDIDDATTDLVLSAFPTAAMTTGQIRAAIKEHSWDAMFQLGRATLARQFWSRRQLHEVMVDFWSNHLNVTNPFDGGWDTRTTYDRDVIRAHALGRFADMLRASARSPAMLRYLDNAKSHRKAVNENYGRELLELHTVGIEGGYTEKDVRHSAYIMTGRTVTKEGEFEYEKDRHWIDPVTVLGFTHANPSRAKGLQVGEAYLQYLATHPATANNIARKLAVRFVCDNPPQTLVDRLARAYLDNGTAIVPVLNTLFRSLEFWIATGLKTRRPLENLVASVRALGVAPGSDVAAALEGMYWQTRNLGQAPLAWVPPNGYPDVAGAWNSAHAMLAVWNLHRALIQGWHKGLTYPKVEGLVGRRPATVGAYLDALAERLVFQPVAARERTALLRFLEAKEGTKVRNSSLGGRLPHLAPLLFDSVYHALR